MFVSALWHRPSYWTWQLLNVGATQENDTFASAANFPYWIVWYFHDIWVAWWNSSNNYFPILVFNTAQNPTPGHLRKKKSFNIWSSFTLAENTEWNEGESQTQTLPPIYLRIILITPQVRHDFAQYPFKQLPLYYPKLVSYPFMNKSFASNTFRSTISKVYSICKV